MPLRLLAAGKTDVGLQREGNEDAHSADVMGDNGASGIFIVSDGMGGYHAGEIASEIAVKTIHDDLAPVLDPNIPQPTVKLTKKSGRKGKKNGKKNASENSAESAAGASTDTATEGDGDDTLERDDSHDTRVLFESFSMGHYADKLTDAIKRGNAAIEDYGETHKEARGLGATVTAAFIVEGRAFIANVGDSRTYLIRDGQIERVTRDHSLVERLVEMEQITPDEVYEHPSRNLIYRSLGANHSEVEVDIFIEELHAGDALLLCCDGLWEMVRDPELLRIITENEDVDKATDLLISTANENGGEDNITAVLVRCVEA